MRGFCLILVIGLLLIVGCNRGDSATGKAVQQIEEVKQPEPVPVVEEQKVEEVKPKEVIKPKPVEKKLEVHFIDVGYGDAILFKYDKDIILVDCGRTDEAIYDYLSKIKVSDIDLLITTVPLKEHIGGCDRVLRNLSVHKVVDNGRSPSDEDFENYLKYRGGTAYSVIDKGDELSVGDIKISVLGANNRLEDTKSNSVVMKVSYGDIDFLLASDCNDECESKLLLGKIMQSEIFKVASHGSMLSNSYEFIFKINPEVSIITSSNDNRYKNLQQTVLDRLSASDVYRTDLHGTIIITTNGKTYNVKTEK